MGIKVGEGRNYNWVFFSIVLKVISTCSGIGISERHQYARED